MAFVEDRWISSLEIDVGDVSLVPNDGPQEFNQGVGLHVISMGFSIGDGCGWCLFSFEWPPGNMWAQCRIALAFCG